jgi:hypothetical protein
VKRLGSPAILKSSLFLGVVLLPLATATVAVEQEEPRTPKMDKVCGRLRFVANVNDGVERDSKPLRKTPVRLYRKSPGTECCAASDKIAEVITGRGGMFAFRLRDSERGLYWLTVDFEGREISQLIRFEPPKGEPESCSNSLVEIDRMGRLALKAIVTVD